MIGLSFFENLTPVREVMYVMRKGSRHPNAARLFALWTAGAESNRIIEKHSLTENITLGTGPVTRVSLQLLKERNISPATWFGSAENLEKLRWLQTSEGREYTNAMARAQKDGK